MTKQKKKPKEEYYNFDDDPKKYRLRKGAKFNYGFVKLAARLKASGFTDEDLAYVFNVKPRTVESWRERYPQFKRACDNGKEMAAAYLVSQGIRAASGYEYEEETIKYVTVQGEDSEPQEIVKERTVTTKYQKPDGQLLMFLLSNFSGGKYRHIRNVEVDHRETRLNINLVGQLEADNIARLAGKLVKKIESKEVPCEVKD